MSSYRYFLPLFYTYYSRFRGRRGIFHFLTENIIFISIPFVYGVITEVYLRSIELVLVYIFGLLVFYIQYEVGYIANDFFATKKEKDPNYRIPVATTATFVQVQIAMRFLLISLILGGIAIYDQKVVYNLIFLILLSQIFFILHNRIRNYRFNFLSISWLHYSKFLLPFCILGEYMSDVKSIFFISFSMYTIGQLYNLITIYNQRLGGVNALPLTVVYMYIIIFLIISFVISGSGLIGIYLFLYIIGFLMKMEKNFFYFPNNR